MSSRPRQGDKARESRLRRSARAQGFVLAKSRTRSPKGRDYGRWWVLDARTLTTVVGETDRMDVDGVAAWLKSDRRRRH